ncbi:MAG TPA: phosphoribosylformylglycinamidine synthase subunit PurL, partial [Actinomycetota bacterium]|nr:phosphoribosylformylglycinamidine synthase subunit PurL [Actinomycetota bacterium]
TGRDGIGGASVLASAEFDEGSEDKRPSVQVGDPFTEKLLIEACLELIRRDLLVGFQDLGAGGISCPTSEMSAKAGTGMRVNVDSVHRREPGMEPFEVMISESQERMLGVVAPPDLDAVLEVCNRWGLEARVIGEVVDSPRLEISSGGEVVADVPARALAEEGPEYHRPVDRPAWIDAIQSAPCGDDPPTDLHAALMAICASPTVASKRWVWEQYDHMIFLGTVQGPGGDAAVVRLPDSEVAVALSVDGPGRFCQLDPYEGARLAVAEAARNVACVGAHPLAVTNCLNFGNPEKPEVMWQFSEVVRGIGDACRELGTPVTGGNVSFYNETKGRAIYPTPVIGMLGVVKKPARALGIGFRRPGDDIVLLGTGDPSDLGGSEYAKVVNGVVAGRPPRLDLQMELKLHKLLFESARDGILVSAHDLSEGGLAIALLESAMANGMGFKVDVSSENAYRDLFCESPTRVLVSCDPDARDRLIDMAETLGVPARLIGVVDGSEMTFGSALTVDPAAVKDAYETALERSLMGGSDK